MAQEQTTNNENCLVLFDRLPRLDYRYKVDEDGDYIPTLYRDGSQWFVSWIKLGNGDMLDEYWADTMEEVIRIAFDKCQAKIEAKQKANTK